MTSAPTSAKENDATSKTSPDASRSERALATSAVKDPSGERVAQTPSAPARTSAAEAKESKESKAAEGGDYFVQVGAFKDQETARRMAASLRAQNYPVTESMKRLGDAMAADTPRPTPRAPVASAGVDRYDVIVTGGSTADINTKLAAKGLAAESATDGVRIRPSLPLRDAVALSKDLNNDGFKVQVRRGGAETATAAAVRTPTATDGDGGGATLYRVRVGGFPDRATAQSALRALKGKGYDPFIAKGRE